MSSSMDFLCSLSSILVLSLLLLISAMESQKHSVAIDLFYRDSPRSPSYDPSLTPSDRLRRSIARSHIRRDMFAKSHLRRTSAASQKKFNTPLYADMGFDGFLTEMYLGSRMQKKTVLADTGSSLIWTQCKICWECYPQDGPLFDPATSKTYAAVGGRDTVCTSNSEVFTPVDVFYPKFLYGCGYKYEYGDYSTTKGIVSKDTMAFKSSDGSTTAFNQTIFGCGNNNQGTYSKDMSGIMGLAQEPYSAAIQFGKTMFSYCLPQQGDPTHGKLYFGPDPNAPQNGIIDVPLLSGVTEYYGVTLTSVNVGSQRVYTTTATNELIVDSGTTYTYFPQTLYTPVIKLITAAIPGVPVQNSNGFTCYANTTLPNVTLTLNFGAVSLTITADKLLVLIKKQRCITLLNGENDPVGILGNVMQANLYIVYTPNKSISFAPTDCATYAGGK